MNKLGIISEIKDVVNYSLDKDQLLIKFIGDISSVQFDALTSSPLELVEDQRDPANRKNGVCGVGDTVIIRVPRSLRNCFIAASLDDLVSHGGWKSVPKEFVLLEQTAQNRTLYHSEETPNDEVKGYIEAVNLSELLVSQADHHSADRKVVSIFDLHKLDIHLDFDHSEISNHWLFPTDAVRSFIYGDGFTELRHDVFTATLWSMLKDVSPKERFTELLKRGSMFLRNLNYNFKLYKQDVSVDKRLEKAREDELNLSEKIHKILINVETKALAIPAILLVACKTSTGVETGSWNNAFIAAGAIFISLNLWFGWDSQKKMTETLEDEIDEAVERITLKSDELDKYEARFNRLKDRMKMANTVKYTSLIISVVLALFFICYALYPLLQNH